MLSANLTITEGLRDGLASAIADPGVRSLEIVIDTEALALTAGPSTACTPAGVSADYGVAIAPQCADSAEPRIWAIRASDSAWTTALYVPDGAAVRAKMLAASALTQARALMQESGTVEHGGFRASDPDEASAGAFSAWREAAHPASGAASAEETARAAAAGEEAATLLQHAAVSASAGGPAGAVPFGVSDGLVPALRGLHDGATAAVVVVVDLADEVMRVSSTKPPAELSSRDDVLALLPEGEPCFVALSRAAVVAGAGAAEEGAVPAPSSGSPAGCALVYSCPDAASVRSRMTHSAAKGTLVQQSKFEAGVEYAELLEVGSAAELGEDLGRLLAAERAAAAAAGTVTLATGAAEGFAKPSRPGRRRRK